jgi:hypothetical protein
MVINQLFDNLPLCIPNGFGIPQNNLILITCAVRKKNHVLLCLHLQPLLSINIKHNTRKYPEWYNTSKLP